MPPQLEDTRDDPHIHAQELMNLREEQYQLQRDKDRRLQLLQGQAGQALADPSKVRPMGSC